MNIPLSIIHRTLATHRDWFASSHDSCLRPLRKSGIRTFKLKRFNVCTASRKPRSTTTTSSGFSHSTIFSSFLMKIFLAIDASLFFPSAKNGPTTLRMYPSYIEIHTQSEKQVIDKHAVTVLLSFLLTVAVIIIGLMRFRCLCMLKDRRWNLLSQDFCTNK